MVAIKGNTIKMTRGDTLIAEVTIKESDGTTYEPAAGDSVRFAAKRQYCDSTPAILKDVNMSTMLLELDPEDTAELEFGRYVWDMELTYASGAVDTFITEGKLELLPEVY